MFSKYGERERQNNSSTSKHVQLLFRCRKFADEIGLSAVGHSVAPARHLRYRKVRLFLYGRRRSKQAQRLEVMSVIARLTVKTEGQQAVDSLEKHGVKNALLLFDNTVRSPCGLSWRGKVRNAQALLPGSREP